jgi:hypothetical protein
LWTICPGWPQTLILPISDSQIARITGVSHQHLAWFFFLWPFTWVSVYGFMQ